MTFQPPARPQLSLSLGEPVKTPSTEVVFSERELAEHMAIFGGTGKGKSKFIELLLRQLIDQRAGVCVIDPHGDLVEDLLAFVLEHYRDATKAAIAERIHYFDPGSPGWRFSYDPFKFTPRPDGLDDYADWLKAKVEAVARIIIRKQGEADFAGKPRLERFLGNVLYAVGMRINDRGDHLSLADAFVLLDPQHERHAEVYGLIAPILPPEVRSDFEKLKNTPPQRQEEWIGSTINRFRSFLSPVVKSIFAGHAKESIDFDKLLASGGILLVNLRRTRSFSVDQANAIGGMFINEIIAAAQIAERADRRSFYLVIDEASRFIGQDLIDALAQCRKWKLSLCMAVQDLSSLKHDEIDMIPKVLSQCGAHVSFQQKHADDLELLGKLFGYALLDFSPLVHEVDRHNGYDYPVFEDETFSTTKGQADQESEGRTSGTGQSQPQHKFNERTDSTNEGSSRGTSRSTNTSESHSVSRKTTPLAKYRTEQQETGQLQRSVNDQLAEVMSVLRTLDRGQAMVCIGKEPPFCLQVERVQTAFCGLPEAERLRLIDGYKRFLARFHPYCFSPQQVGDDNQRISNFLQRFTDSPTAPKPPPTSPVENPFSV
jgi:hypothetical protein